jgi:competence protein ComEA
MLTRRRLDALSRSELAGLGLVVVATLAGAGLWYSRSLPRAVEIAHTPAPSMAPVGSASVVAPVSGEPGAPGTVLASVSASAVDALVVVVDVTGWVRRPGVYEFESGARIVDAVERAGGPKPRADLSLLNLASLLVDGQQVLVFRKGATATTTGGPSEGAFPSGSSGAGLINVNTAGETELEEINGIGEVLAAAIVAYREEHGSFTSIDQLEDVSGIGPTTLEEMRDQVTI